MREKQSLLQCRINQFKAGNSLSYAIYGGGEREAAIINPRRRLFEEYQNFLAERDLSLKWAIDLSASDDNGSATELFPKEICISSKSFDHLTLVNIS